MFFCSKEHQRVVSTDSKFQLSFAANDLTPSLSLSFPSPRPPSQSSRIDLERAQTSVWKSFPMAGYQLEGEGGDTRTESETIPRSQRENPNLAEAIPFHDGRARGSSMFGLKRSNIDQIHELSADSLKLCVGAD